MTPELDLDLKSLANVYDPFPLYRWLRDHDPVHRSDSLNGWVASEKMKLNEKGQILRVWVYYGRVKQSNPEGVCQEP